MPSVDTYFTPANAAAMAAKAHEARRLRAAMIAEAETEPKPVPQLTDDGPAIKLARVQDELIERMTGNDDPKAVSALAQALKNVREVYHLVTGQAKPGTLQPDKRNNRRQPSVQSLPEPDDTPQHVVPPSNPTSDVNGNGV